MFWGIVPIGSFLLVILTLSVQRTLKAELIVGIIDTVFLLFALALWNPKRFALAMSAVLASVFLWYCVYVIDQLANSKPRRWFGEGPTVINAMLGLLYIGVPALAGSIGSLISHQRNKKMRPDASRVPIQPS